MKALFTLLLLTATSCSSNTNMQFKTVVDKKMFATGYHQFEPRERVVIIDTGLSPKFMKKDYMCKDIAHVGFTPGLNPGHPHGDNITSIVRKKMDKDKYCISVFQLRNYGRQIMGLGKALEYVTQMDRVYVINLSLIQARYSHRNYNTISNAIYSKGIRFNSAAGNSSLDLDPICVVYPACYSKLLEQESQWYPYRRYFKVIGALADYSNYGNVVDIFLPGGPMGEPSMRGTSMATALYTNMLIRK